jgi:hypothetical protein
MTKVLVLLPMRNLSSRAMGAFGAIFESPAAFTNEPLPGAQIATTAPGTGLLPPNEASSFVIAAFRDFWISASNGFSFAPLGWAWDRDADDACRTTRNADAQPKATLVFTALTSGELYLHNATVRRTCCIMTTQADLVDFDSCSEILSFFP